MKASIPIRHRRPETREQGMALLLSAVILMLVSMLAFSAMQHSEQEATSGARSRSTMRTIYAADAGIELALSRLTQSPPNLSAFNVGLADGANFQSRTRTQGSPQLLAQAGIGEPEEGYSLNVGAGVSHVSRVFLVNVTATAGGSTAELEARLARSAADSAGY
jgi:Tfp pilus assembly protein PilX